MKTLGFALSLSALVLAGCASRPAHRPADTAPGADAAPRPPKVEVVDELAGTKWVLVELEGAPVAPAPEGWPARSLEFGREGLRAAGHAGVNFFGGRYTQDKGALRFGPLALTRRLGPEELMQAEQGYTRVLSRVVEWQQEGSLLVLSTPGSRRAAVFERVVEAEQR